MRLAAHNRITLEEIKDRMSAEEVMKWAVFDKICGYPDIYFMTWKIVEWVGGCFFKKAPKMEEVIPYFGDFEAKRKQTTADHKAMFAGFRDIKVNGR